MYINKGEIRVKKYILLSFLLSVILLFSGLSAYAAETENKRGRNIVSGMNLTAEGSYVQDPVISAEHYSQANNSSTEIPLSSGLKAYFSFKAPPIGNFLEKAKVQNDKLAYYRALFGFNISF
jgi:hypothetical protein